MLHAKGMCIHKNLSIVIPSTKLSYQNHLKIIRHIRDMLDCVCVCVFASEYKEDINVVRDGGESTNDNDDDKMTL